MVTTRAFHDSARCKRERCDWRGRGDSTGLATWPDYYKVEAGQRRMNGEAEGRKQQGRQTGGALADEGVC